MSERDENIYEAFKKSVEDYNRARSDYELYQDSDKLREMIKTYYNTIGKTSGCRE